jgi:uncharacterized protein involved in exopolysaccharide biosynthesis
MNPETSAMANVEAYGLRELIRDFRAKKWFLISSMFVCCLLAVMAGLLIPKEYTAKLTFEPVLSRSASSGFGSGVSSVTGALGGLASLAGGSLPGNTEDNEAIAVLQSELLTQKFIKRNNLLPTLYEHKWNQRRNEWNVDNSTGIPTLWDANRLFKRKIRTVIEDQKTGLYILSIRWKNPVQSAQWANELVAMTNSYLRHEAVQRAERDIEYLNAQAANARTVEIKRAIYTLLEEQIDREMLAKGLKEYALKVIDPAFVPERASSLGVFAWGLIGLIVGGTVGVLLIFLRAVLSE